MESQDKYWSDYTEFIKLSEDSTGLSPADLLDQYEILITELETKGTIEWIYEDMETESTITKIHKLLNHALLKDNILNNQFKEKINALDERMKKFLLPSLSNDETWWLDFSRKKIDWSKN